MSAWEKACAELEPYIALDDQRSDPLAWWHQHAQMERTSLLEVRAEVEGAMSRAAWSRECAIVALRMLQRAGKLKATTDDERAAVELAGYMLDLPAANRRLLHPLADDYVARAVDVGQQMLLDTTSQESVNEEAA